MNTKQTTRGTPAHGFHTAMQQYGSHQGDMHGYSMMHTHPVKYSKSSNTGGPGVTVHNSKEAPMILTPYPINNSNHSGAQQYYQPITPNMAQTSYVGNRYDPVGQTATKNSWMSNSHHTSIQIQNNLSNVTKVERDTVLGRWPSDKTLVSNEGLVRGVGGGLTMGKTQSGSTYQAVGHQYQLNQHMQSEEAQQQQMLLLQRQQQQQQQHLLHLNHQIKLQQQQQQYYHDLEAMNLTAKSALNHQYVPAQVDQVYHPNPTTQRYTNETAHQNYLGIEYQVRQQLQQAPQPQPSDKYHQHILLLPPPATAVTPFHSQQQPHHKQSSLSQLSDPYYSSHDESVNRYPFPGTSETAMYASNPYGQQLQNQYLRQNHHPQQSQTSASTYNSSVLNLPQQQPPQQHQQQPPQQLQLHQNQQPPPPPLQQQQQSRPQERQQQAKEPSLESQIEASSHESALKLANAPDLPQQLSEFSNFVQRILLVMLKPVTYARNRPTSAAAAAAEAAATAATTSANIAGDVGGETTFTNGAILKSESDRCQELTLYIENVLQTTDVSRTMVLLALKYVHMLCRNPNFKVEIGKEKNILIFGLMLANKILDDHTFTNRTWSDVSKISLEDLNNYEIHLLNMLNHSNFIIPRDVFSGWVLSLQRYWMKQCQPLPRGSTMMNQPTLYNQTPSTYTPISHTVCPPTNVLVHDRKQQPQQQGGAVDHNLRNNQKPGFYETETTAIRTGSRAAPAADGFDLNNNGGRTGPQVGYVYAEQNRLFSSSMHCSVSLLASSAPSASSSSSTASTSFAATTQRSTNSSIFTLEQQQQQFQLRQKNVMQRPKTEQQQQQQQILQQQQVQKQQAQQSRQLRRDRQKRSGRLNPSQSLTSTAEKSEIFITDSIMLESLDDDDDVDDMDDDCSDSTITVQSTPFQQGSGGERRIESGGVNSGGGGMASSQLHTGSAIRHSNMCLGCMECFPEPPTVTVPQHVYNGSLLYSRNSQEWSSFA
ncbi:hypothetical protein BDR26DRAFT_859175 [Obelidium mucronatum]|nr:hypothetical protein BDR26DRAFT_859175 [Obelidium mucronatum]